VYCRIRQEWLSTSRSYDEVAMKKILVLLLSLFFAASAFGMDQSAIPPKFGIPWGNSAGTAYIRSIPQSSQVGIQNCAASLTDGFPPLTFVPSTAGGCPPFGADFNGILKQVSQWNQWQGAGAPVIYDSGFSATIGGYPKSAVLSNASMIGCYWVSIIDNNASDPDTGGSNWLGFCAGSGPSGYNSALSTANGGYPKGTLLLNTALNSFWFSTVNNNTTDPNASGAGWTNLFNATEAQFWGGTAGVASTNNWTLSIANWTAAQVGIPIRFIAPATNTGATTINVSGVGALSITRNSAGGPIALVGGEMLTGEVQTIVPDGVGNFQLQTHASVTYNRTLVITSSGTYTPTPGTAFAKFTVIGGGGAGGGVQNTTASQLSAGGGGGAGGMGYITLKAAAIGSGVAVTVGTGGSGHSSGAGSPGTASVVGGCTAGGGTGGGLGTANGGVLVIVGGTGGAISSGCDVGVIGSSGSWGFISVVNSSFPATYTPGNGGPGFLGGGLAQQTTTPGGASGYGTGGNGAANSESDPPQTGGAGAGGAVIVEEWIYN
jgi:hypothetical protein